MANFSAPFSEHEVRAKEIVDSQTWGHLFPPKGKHLGYVIFAKSAYGQAELLDAEFEQTPSSPWLYGAVTSLLAELDADLDEGIYIWRGYCYRKKQLVRAALDEDDENEYAKAIVLQGKIAGKKTLAEIVRGKLLENS